MTTLYVDNIAPNLQSRVSVPGHVIQVVSNAVQDTSTAISTSTWVNMVEVTITPTSATNKIYLQASSCFYMSGTVTLSTAIFKDGSSVKTTGNGWLGYNKHDVSNNHRDTITHIFMDTAGSTGSITYSFQVYANGSGLEYSASGTPTIITAMEIAG
jgi:hypothetical protein